MVNNNNNKWTKYLQKMYLILKLLVEYDNNVEPYENIFSKNLKKLKNNFSFVFLN